MKATNWWFRLIGGVVLAIVLFFTVRNAPLYGNQHQPSVANALITAIVTATYVVNLRRLNRWWGTVHRGGRPKDK